MMAVFAGDRRRQPKNKARLSPSGNQFKADRGQVMALVNDEVPVIANNIVNFSFSDQALDEGHIHDPGRPAFAAANSADLGPRQIEESGQALDPLIHELTPMNEHECNNTTLSNHTHADDGLTESSRGSKNTSVVFEQRFERAFLVLAQRTSESHVDSATCLALVNEFDPNLQFIEKRPDHVEATARKRNVLFGQFGT